MQPACSNCITELATEIPRCFSTSIQSEVACRPLLRAFTVPAIWIAPPNSSSFSVRVVLPASGWAMIANVRRRRTSRTRSGPPVATAVSGDDIGECEDGWTGSVIVSSARRRPFRLRSEVLGRADGPRIALDQHRARDIGGDQGGHRAQRADGDALVAVGGIDPEGEQGGPDVVARGERRGEVGPVVAEHVALHRDAVLPGEPDQLPGEVVVEGTRLVAHRDRDPVLARVLPGGGGAVVDRDQRGDLGQQDRGGDRKSVVEGKGAERW